MKPYLDKNKEGFTLTKEDFKWEFFTAGGHGGQKQNKTSSACRCTHEPSNSVGISRDERSQPQNKKLAFQRCVNSESFKQWCKIEISRFESNKQKSVEELVEQEMQPQYLLIQGKSENSEWVNI